MAESLNATISDQTCCQMSAAEPPLAGPHERWCGRTGVSHPLLPDYSDSASIYQAIVMQIVLHLITRKYQSDDGNWLITKREEKYWINRSTGERKEYPEVLTEYLNLLKKCKSGEEASQKMDEKYESQTEIIEIDEGGSGDSYWTATAANAIKPLYQLIALSQMRPDGVWSEES